MKRFLVALTVLLALSRPGPVFSQDTTATPAGTPTTAAGAQTGSNTQTVSQFNDQLSAMLALRGIGPFFQPIAADSLSNQGLLYRPFQASLGGPFGSIYGTLDVYAGLGTTAQPTAAAAGPPNDNPDFPNLEIDTTVNVSDFARGHAIGNIIRFPWSSPGKRQVGLPEAYGELYTKGNLGTGGNTYNASVRLGKMGQLEFPFIDPLVLVDRRPSGYFVYQGAMLIGEVDNAQGIGGHGSLFERIGSSHIGPQGFVNDLYGVYRHDDATHNLFYEGRLGWLPYALDDIPHQGHLGIDAYAGTRGRDVNIGVFVGDQFSTGLRFGASITLARSRVTELYGLAPTHIYDQPFGLGIEVPVAQIALLTATHPTTGEAVIGQTNEIRTWNVGSEVGVGSTDVLPAGSWGTRTGTNVRRVLSRTPWWLYQGSISHIPSKDFGKNPEDWDAFRQDVQYVYYRVLPLVTYRLTTVAVDAETQKPIAGAHITLTNPAVEAQTRTSSGRGEATFHIRLAPTGAAAVHIAGLATGYQPLAQDVTLQPNTVNRVTLQFQPLLGIVTGTAVDSVTGQPVPDAEIALLPANNQPPILHTTGPNGDFQFTDVHPGTYSIRFHKPGFTDVTVPVTVVGGQTTTVNFTTAAQRGGAVVHVVDGNNNPIANATVTILNATGATAATGVTGADGTFVARLDPGTYTINVTAAGFAQGTATVTVPAGQIQDVTVTLTRQP